MISNYGLKKIFNIFYYAVMITVFIVHFWNPYELPYLEMMVGESIVLLSIWLVYYLFYIDVFALNGDFSTIDMIGSSVINVSIYWLVTLVSSLIFITVIYDGEMKYITDVKVNYTLTFNENNSLQSVYIKDSNSSLFGMCQVETKSIYKDMKPLLDDCLFVEEHLTDKMSGSFSKRFKLCGNLCDMTFPKD